MQYNYKGVYNQTTSYVVKDVVSYQQTTNDPIRYYFCLSNNTGQLPSNVDNQYWGIVNALSNFPNAVDTFTNRTPIQASDKPNLARFQELSLKSSLSPSEQDELNTLTQTLRNKLILSDDFNALQDSISNLQMFFKDNVEGYINTKQNEMNSFASNKTAEINDTVSNFNTTVSNFNTYVNDTETDLQTYTDNKKNEIQAKIDTLDDKGNYNSSATYMKNNFVRYDFQTYICLKDNTTNVTPTDDGINWRLMAQRGGKGEQGIPGLNLVFRYTYDPLASYVAGDAVEYGGSIFYAKQQSTGETPSSNGVSWTIFMPRASVLISATNPINPVDKTVWIDTNTGIFKWYDANSSSWISTNSDNANKLGGQLPSYYATAQDVTDINDKTGLLSDLNTTQKDNFVGAINETNQNIDLHKQESMPHHFIGTDNKTYRYGFTVTDDFSGLIFTYEEDV